MAEYIDIHTHIVDLSDKSVLPVINISLPDEDIPDNNLFSAGFHPWSAGSISPENIERTISKIIKEKNLVALGECGIDRSIETPVDIQIKVFLLQMDIAKKYNKPLIIHCVRAYSDLLQLLKVEKFNKPVIIHNFQGNLYQAKSLMKHNCYFSFGESLLRDRSMVHETFKKLPAERIFLETDESNISIREIYSRAALLRRMEENDLKMVIINNLNSCFGSSQ